MQRRMAILCIDIGMLTQHMCNACVGMSGSPLYMYQVVMDTCSGTVARMVLHVPALGMVASHPSLRPGPTHALVRMASDYPFYTHASRCAFAPALIGI